VGIAILYTALTSQKSQRGGRRRSRTPKGGTLLAFFIFALVIGLFVGDVSLSVSWEAKSKVPEIFTIITMTESGEIVEQEISTNPYRLLPQSIRIPSGGVLIAIKGKVKYNVLENVNEPFYGCFMVGAIRERTGPDQCAWLYSDVATYKYRGNDADGNDLFGMWGLASRVPTVRALRFTGAQQGGTWESTYVFPFSVYVEGFQPIAYVLPASKEDRFGNPITVKWTSGEYAGPEYTLEHQLREAGFPEEEDITIKIWFGYVKESAGTGNIGEDDMLALPKYAPLIFKIRLSGGDGSSQSIQIVSVSWSGVTQQVIKTQATDSGGQAYDVYTFWNPILPICLALLVVAIVIHKLF